MRQPRSNPNPQSVAAPSAVMAQQASVVPRRSALSARAMLALLREQSVPELEARRRLNSDPRLRAELELTASHGRSG